MGGFLRVDWQASDRGLHQALDLKKAAIDADVQILEESPSHWLGVYGPRPPGLLRLSSTCTVIGEVFDGFDPTTVHPGQDADDVAVAHWLTLNRWGRYVAVFHDSFGATRAIFRDPSGSQEVFSWRSGPLTLVASATPDWLMNAALPRVRIDWSRLSLFYDDPTEVHGAPALEGVSGPGPGRLFRLADSHETIIWDPVQIASSPVEHHAWAQEALRTRLDRCVGALGGTGQDLAAELSGGLDSAIVASAFAGRGLSPDLWINSYAVPVETDERRWATSAAALYRADLTCLKRGEVVFTPEAFESTAGGPRPSQNGRDIVNDVIVSEACAQAGVTGLITGKGGDALFFQMHSPLVFADLWQRRGWRALASPLLPGVARWTRASVWSVLNLAQASARQESKDRFMGNELGPAKQMQIRAITDGLAYVSPCRRSQVVDMIHPLMAQPLVEWALRTPVPLLVAGGRDRALARDAFADRLPPEIRHRVSKGDYSAYFNRQAASNLPFLREYLLGGRLVEKGIIDGDLLENLLQEDRLRWTGGATACLAAASLEAWVRLWERRGA